MTFSSLQNYESNALDVKYVIIIKLNLHDEKNALWDTFHCESYVPYFAIKMRLILKIRK